MRNVLMWEFREGHLHSLRQGAITTRGLKGNRRNAMRWRLLPVSVLIGAMMFLVQSATAEPPAIAFTSGPSGIVATSSATFTFTINRAPKAIQGLACVLDSVPHDCAPLISTGKQSSTSGVTFMALSDGPHTLAVSATLADGGLAVALRSWEVRLVRLLAIEVSPPVAIIPMGTTLQYGAIGTYSDGSVVDLTNQVAWSTSNSTIAYISSSSGLVTTASQGITTVQARLGDVVDRAVLNVGPALLVRIDVTPQDPILSGGFSLQLRATGFWTDGSASALEPCGTFPCVIWSSSDDIIATVSLDGVVSASTREPGVVTITATSPEVSTPLQPAVSNSTLVTVTP